MFFASVKITYVLLLFSFHYEIGCLKRIKDTNAPNDLVSPDAAVDGFVLWHVVQKHEGLVCIEPFGTRIGKIRIGTVLQFVAADVF